ncbi:MAG: EAL domain-containing protein [Phycisphaerales bacterium]
MRIQHHLSIILFVAVVGAIGLAATVGVLMGGVEESAHAYGRATDQQRQVDVLVDGGQVLMEIAAQITPRSSAVSFGTADRAIHQAATALGDLRRDAVAFNPESLDQALRSIEYCRELADDRSTGVQHPDDLERFRRGVAGYVTALTAVQITAADEANRQGRTLARRRRVILLLIGVICFAYLALIERVRHWTTRHLIDPMQMLADTARQIMSGKTTVPTIAHGNTEELETMAGMLASFGDTIKSNVKVRTAQVVRQKQRLETEVRVRRRAEDELRFAALRDRLTGLSSRDIILDRIGQCLDRAQRRRDYEFAVLFIDVDQLMEVHDNLGRSVGDQLTIAVAERFRKWLGNLAGVVAVESISLGRLGGNDFAVLLDGLDGRDDASIVGERVEEALAEPFVVQDKTLKVSASIGIALAEDGIESAEALLRNADAAMHFARAGGKGCFVVFRPGMNDAVTAREEQALHLRRGMELGQFAVVYQPIVSLKSGQICGFEALARWEDPERGSISPVEFIPQAEDTGVIIDLGRWVLDKACRMLAEWRKAIPEKQALSISVNVSQHQLAHPKFVEELEQILADAGISAADLRLEITESVIMENPETVTDVLERIRALGAEIHMDDFGTGYSSLSYLHRLPIDVLKIDRAFMSSLSTNHDYGDVVHTVVALARTLRMGVTVEGVETEQQLAQVRALDCDFAQGFYFSEPVTADEARAMLVARRRWSTAA